MTPLEQENEIEVVRQYAILYRDEAKRLATENAKLKGNGSQEAQEFLHARLRERPTRTESRGVISAPGDPGSRKVLFEIFRSRA